MEDKITGIDFENEESGICRDFFNLKYNGKPIGKIIIFVFIILAIVSFFAEPYLARVTQYDVVKYNEEYEDVDKNVGEEERIWHYDFKTACKEGLHEWKGLFRDKCRICGCREKTKAVRADIICPTCKEFYKDTLFESYTVCEICGEMLTRGYEISVEDIDFTTCERVAFAAMEILFHIIRIGGILAVVVIVCAQISSYKIKNKNK